MTNILKNSDKSKFVYLGYGIAVDGAGSWSFGYDFARNGETFRVDNSSSSHTDNRKIIFLVLSEGTTYDIDGSFGTPDKKFSINFSQTRVKSCLSFH